MQCWPSAQTLTVSHVPDGFYHSQTVNSLLPEGLHLVHRGRPCAPLKHAGTLPWQKLEDDARVKAQNPIQDANEENVLCSLRLPISLWDTDAPEI